MPLLFNEFLHDGSIIGVWKITESANELYLQVSLSGEEEKTLQTYKNENRKRQWLSYRALLKVLIEENYQIAYSDFGKPYLRLQKKNKHISITHSGDYSAIIINENLVVGIDIEKPEKRIDRVSDRFLSDHELGFIDTKHRLEHLTLCWAVKEALFKIHGNLCYDFKQQIIVDRFDFSNSGWVNCSIISDEGHLNYKVHYKKIEDYFLAYVAE
jgi:4'-phosphopantetheinyl transferase